MLSKYHSIELIETLRDAGFEPESYSGRGMYGKSCVALKVNYNSLWDVARSIPTEFDIEAPLTDSLGLGTVMYWPSFPWVEDDEFDDEGDDE